MRSSSAALALASAAAAAVLGAAGCAPEQGLGPPAPSAVEPASGYSTGEMPIRIVGDAFYVRASQDLEGDAGDAVSDAFRAWLGDVELLDVVRVDATTLGATVPAGLVPGSDALAVEGPDGRSPAVAGAYAAIAGSAPVITIALAADPPSVVAGETGHVSARVTNLGPGPLASVQLQLKWVPNGHATMPLDGQPPLRDLAVGEGFGWRYDVPTTEPGTIVLEAKVSAVDPETGAGVPGPRERIALEVL